MLFIWLRRLQTNNYILGNMEDFWFSCYEWDEKIDTSHMLAQTLMEKSGKSTAV